MSKDKHGFIREKTKETEAGSVSWINTNFSQEQRFESEIENTMLRIQLNRIMQERFELEKANEVYVKITTKQKLVYFLTLFVFDKISFLKFLKVEKPAPFVAKIKIGLKEESARNDADEPQKGRKETEQETDAKRMERMRLYKENYKKLRTEVEQNKFYLLKRKNELKVILETELLLEGKLIRLIDLPADKYVPAPTVFELNASIMPIKPHKNKYYTQFVRRIQIIKDAEGIHFFNKIQHENI